MTPLIYVPLLDDAAVYPNVPWMGDASVYLGGDGLTPTIAGTATGGHAASPMLSPDKSEVVWGENIAGSNLAAIMRNAIDGLSETTVISWTGPNANLDPHPSWSPDGTQIVYIKQTTSTQWTIRRVNRDGTGDTLLHTPPADRPLHGVSYSPSGDYIAFGRVNLSGQGSLWVMEDDGSNATLLTVSNYPLTWEEWGTPAWQRGADVLGYLRYENESTPVTFETINYDGTGQTTHYSDSSRILRGTTRLAWFSDDSGIATLKRTNGTTLFNASTARLVKVSTAGAVTEIAGTSHDTPWGRWHIPICIDNGNEDPRIYFTPSAISGFIGVASVLEDGSDYRVDHDMSAGGAGGSGEIVFNGFEHRGLH